MDWHSCNQLVNARPCPCLASLVLQMTRLKALGRKIYCALPSSDLYPKVLPQLGMHSAGKVKSFMNNRFGAFTRCTRAGRHAPILKGKNLSLTRSLAFPGTNQLVGRSVCHSERQSGRVTNSTCGEGEPSPADPHPGRRRIRATGGLT